MTDADFDLKAAKERDDGRPAFPDEGPIPPRPLKTYQVGFKFYFTEEADSHEAARLMAEREFAEHGIQNADVEVEDVTEFGTGDN
jgi:hypothetical protein